MKKFGIAMAVLAGAFCAQVSAQSQNLTMQIAGKSRKYILYAPTGLAANPPLVYVIHGFNMTAQQEVGLTRMNAVADREKFVVVYPDALPDANNQQSWDMSGPNDYAFLLTIIDTVHARHKIDRKRIYVSGFSQGGFMSFQIACRYADIVAAIAPVSGLINGSCSPKRPVPMKFTFGTNEGFDINTFIQSMNKWVQLNGCGPTPAVISPYPPANPNSVVTRLSYTGCKEGADVVVDTVKGGPHEWPMNTNTKINNSEEIWAFFKKYTLPGASALERAAAPARRLAAAYSQGRVRLEGAAPGARIKVFDHRGVLAATADAREGRFEFRGRSAGVYWIRLEGGGHTATAPLVVP